MSDSPDTTTHPTNQTSRLHQVLAWVGIVAGVVFIVAVVFSSGLFVGRAITGSGYGWHRGYETGKMRSGDCPMMQMMQPGGMGPGGMPGMGGPATAPSMSPPATGR